jgi:hypothetical protein
MVAAKAKFQARDYENEQPNARKRHCSKGALALGCNSVCQGGDPAADFLHQFNLAQGLCSPDQTINELVWRCWAEFNVLMRSHAGMLRDLPLCGYMSLTRTCKSQAFRRLLEAEGLGGPGSSWPLHVHVISSVLQRFFYQFPDASLCRYTVKQPDWLGQWCTKWGNSGCNITLYAVNVYDHTYEPMHVHGGELQAPVENLNRTLFVPMMGA